MIRYQVYLEGLADGPYLGHVVGLPGCVARGSSREEVLRLLPQAIRETHAWLRRHGEALPPTEEPVELDLTGEVVGVGPFDPGNAAALFPADREPLSRSEMERFFRLMAYCRADLLALIRDLPAGLLTWQPKPRALAIHDVLRHVGNAEEWYVSRLVDPVTLPSEWEHDADLPLAEFLEMERRTAEARLRLLTESELAAVWQPTCWTSHPKEMWSARKVLRRFVDHEREHTAQIAEILAAWQQCGGTVR